MNDHKLASTIDSPETFTTGRSRKWKSVWALLLGLPGFFLMLFLRQLGEGVAFIGLGVYFLSVQYFLSCGNPRAVRQDWDLILKLNFVLLASVVTGLWVRSRHTELAFLKFTIFTFVCSFAGAALAGSVARTNARIHLGLRSCRRALLAGVVLLFAIALAIAVGVIPPLRADTFPDADPQAATYTFLVFIAFNLLAAAALWFTVFRSSKHGRVSKAVPGIFALLILMFAFALTGAGLVFRGHGPAINATTILLHICAATECAVALLALVTALFAPNKSVL